jgi:RNA polymerase sigma factor (sigma-70 family)
MTDNEIIRGIRDNDQAAWRELYHSAFGKVRARIQPLLGSVRHQTFEDIFEDACLTLMDAVKDGTVREGESTNLAGFLYTVCQRTALRLSVRESHPKEPRKTLSKVNGKIVVEDPKVELAYDPEQAAEEEKEALAFLDRVLRAIPEDCRQLFRRFYWDKMPMKDIAPAMGLKNENVAKTKKNRCMDKFKEIAKAMLADDEKAEAAVRRTVERDALRDLLQDLRKEESGDLARAALKDKE